MSRSHRANHFGTIAEKRAAKKYKLTFARSSWCDAERANGKPVEIKSTMHRHSDGQPGNFKLYEAYHRRLRRNDGYYAFIVYRPHSGSISVLKTTMVHSSQLPRLSWHGGGAHRGTRQAKLAIEDVF
jgi:hypothetical protein